MFDRMNAMYKERSYIYTDSDNARQTFICTLRVPQDGITEYSDVSKRDCKQRCLDI